jgi:adenylate cyclase
MSDQCWAFGPFVLDPHGGVLLRDGAPAAVGYRAVLLLAAMLDRPGEVLTKSELIDAAWQGAAVEEANLSVQIALLRKHLGTSPDGSDWIGTVHRIGYRFAGPVERRKGPERTASPGREPPSGPSIVVLPFANLSGDREQDYLADGFAVAITSTLSRIRQFLVIERNSAFTYKGRALDIVEVGRELGVAYALEGSVQRSGQRLRVTVQLVETGGGAHVWAERYDGTLDGIFELQDHIAERVAGALQPSVRLAEIGRSARKRPQDLGAYDYAMRALPHVWALERVGSAAALELLGKAQDLDPDYPLALSLAAWCHAQRSVYNWAEDIAGSQAEALRLAERAVQLSAEDPLILAVLGAVHSFLRNYGTARVLLERAVAIDPNAAWAWGRLGWLETYIGHPEVALEHFERALRLSPLDPTNFNVHVGIGSAHHVRREFDEAVQSYRRALEERPNASWIYRQLAPALADDGRPEQAKAAFAELVEQYPDLTAARVRQALVFQPEVVEGICTRLRDLGLPD